MADVILNIDPSVWNATKFFALAIVITPCLELLLHRVINSKATCDVLSGKQLSFSESNFGIFSLHSSYWGRPRNKSFLVLIALPILAADLLVEFSFSATTVDVSEETQVWLQPLHETRYANTSGADTNLLSDSRAPDPSQFPSESASTCIAGPITMSKSITNKTIIDTPHYIAGFEYRMNGTYVIRNSYMTSDNRSTVCSASKTVGHVNFVLPQVVQVRGATKGEGVIPSENNTNSEELRAVFSRGYFQYIGKLNISLIAAEVWVHDDVACVQPRDFGFLCAALVGETFVLVNTDHFEGPYSLWSLRKLPSNIRLAVILSASGAPVSGMKSRDRRIRFLASLAGSRIITSYRNGDKPSQRLIAKDTLVRVAFMVMFVANEEGIGGIYEEIGVRSIKKSEKQSATMKRMAFIPIGILLCSMVALVLVEGTYRMMITQKLRRNENNRLSRLVRSQNRVETSMQWFSERACDDLRRSGILENVLLSDISAKYVSNGDEECFQLLPPLSSRRHQYGDVYKEIERRTEAT